MKYFCLLVFIIGIACNVSKFSETQLAGRYFGQATDAYAILVISQGGDAKKYNGHMGGKHEFTGTWKILGDSIQITYLESRSSWFNSEMEPEDEILKIDWKRKSLGRYFNRVNEDPLKMQMTDELIQNVIDEVSNDVKTNER